jgi:hypothetical protein
MRVKRALILLVCVALLIVPAFAYTYEYTAKEGTGVTSFGFDCSEGTTGSYELRLQNGNTITGDFSYLTSAPVWGFVPTRTATISIEGESATYPYVTGGDLIVVVGASNRVLNSSQTIGISAGQIINSWNAKAKIAGENSPIVGYTLTSDMPIDEPYTLYEDIGVLVRNYEQQSINNWLENVMKLAYDSFWAAYDFLESLIYWIKFFFVDNLALILALFFAVPMAFAARNSRGNPERFMRQYFKTLRGFFEFIFQLWRLLTETIGTVIGWFKLV